MGVARCENLEQIRERIDALDREIVSLLARRGEYVLQAAAFKRDAAHVRAPARAATVIDNAGRLAEEAGADRAVVERIYREIVAAFTDAELAAHVLKFSSQQC